MADDLLTSLVSGAPQTSEQTAAIVSELRRQRAYGQLASLSGDSALQDFGKSALTGVQEDLRQSGLQQFKNANLEESRARTAESKSALAQAMAIAKMDEEGRNARLERELEAGKYDRNSTAAQNLLDKEEQRKDQFAQRLSTTLTQNSIPQVHQAIATLNNTLGKFKTAEEIPGVGYLKNLPGASLFLSPEGKDIKSQMMGVSNDLLKMYSGLTVTPSEAERRNLELMASGQFSAKDFMTEWPRIIQRFNEVKQGVLGGYKPEIQQRYTENGGMPLGDLTPQDPISRAARAAAAGTPGTATTGLPSAVPGGSAGSQTGMVTHAPDGSTITPYNPAGITGKQPVDNLKTMIGGVWKNGKKITDVETNKRTGQIRVVLEDGSRESI